MILRRSLAAKESEGAQAKAKREQENLKTALEQEGGHMIYSDVGRFQAIKSRIDNFVPENMSYEDLEDLKAQLPHSPCGRGSTWTN